MEKNIQIFDVFFGIKFNDYLTLEQDVWGRQQFRNKNWVFKKYEDHINIISSLSINQMDGKKQLKYENEINEKIRFFLKIKDLDFYNKTNLDGKTLASLPLAFANEKDKTGLTYQAFEFVNDFIEMDFKSGIEVKQVKILDNNQNEIYSENIVSGTTKFKKSTTDFAEAFYTIKILYTKMTENTSSLIFVSHSKFNKQTVGLVEIDPNLIQRDFNKNEEIVFEITI